MYFPLTFLDLSLWLAITAIILLITSEMLSLSHGKTSNRIAKKRLRTVAFAVAILFLVTIAIRIIGIILTL